MLIWERDVGTITYRIRRNESQCLRLDTDDIQRASYIDADRTTLKEILLQVLEHGVSDSD